MRVEGVAGLFFSVTVEGTSPQWPLMNLPGDDDLAALQDEITIWTARHIRCFQDRSGLHFGGPDVVAKLAAEHKLWFKADEAHAKARGKVRTAKARLMNRIQAREDRIIEQILLRPISSLADVRVLLQFMARECPELMSCPGNDRQGDLTRSFDLLVAAVDKLAGSR